MNYYFVSSYSRWENSVLTFPWKAPINWIILFLWLEKCKSSKKSLCFCFINIKFLINVSQIYSCFWKEDRLNMEFYCSYIMSVSLKLAKFGHAPWKPHLKENLPLKNSSVWDVFRTLSNIYGWGFTQAAKQSCSVKKVFLEIS